MRPDDHEPLPTTLLTSERRPLLKHDAKASGCTTALDFVDGRCNVIGETESKLRLERARIDPFSLLLPELTLVVVD